jgi:hypothetical protein
LIRSQERDFISSESRGVVTTHSLQHDLLSVELRRVQALFRDIGWKTDFLRIPRQIAQILLSRSAVRSGRESGRFLAAEVFTFFPLARLPSFDRCPLVPSVFVFPAPPPKIGPCDIPGHAVRTTFYE